MDRPGVVGSDRGDRRGGRNSDAQLRKMVPPSVLIQHRCRPYPRSPAAKSKDRTPLSTSVTASMNFPVSPLAENVLPKSIEIYRPVGVPAKSHRIRGGVSHQLKRGHRAGRKSGRRCFGESNSIGAGEQTRSAADVIQRWRYHRCSGSPAVIHCSSGQVGLVGVGLLDGPNARSAPCGAGAVSSCIVQREILRSG